MYCMTTGRIDYDGETIVNKDYKQSSNIIDFLSYSTFEESSEMDNRKIYPEFIWYFNFREI